MWHDRSIAEVTATRCTAGGRRAFTLVELTVALSVSVILLGGIASALVLATHALPGPTDTATLRLTGARVADDVADEIQFATTIQSRTDSAVTFSVADRGHGAAGDETIAYAWSGVAGDPLTRQYNGGTVVSVLQNVHDFALSYDLVTLTTEESGETTQSPFTEVVDIPKDTVAAENSAIVGGTTWYGQFFLPDPTLLPLDVVRWKVDGVYLPLMQDGQAGGAVAVELQDADAFNHPTGTAYDTTVFQERDLDKTWTTRSISTPSSPWLDVTQGICVVVRDGGGKGTACALLYQVPALPIAHVSFFETTDDGVGLQTVAGAAVTMFTVYATVETSTATTTTTSFVVGANVAVQVGENVGSRVETRVEVFNAP